MRTKLAVALVIVVVLLGAMALAQTVTMPRGSAASARTMPQVLPSNARVLQGEKLIVDGKALSTPTPLVMVGKTVMVPALPVLQDLKAAPKWDARTQTLIGTAKGQEIWVKGGDKNARLGTKEQRLGETPFVYRNELYVPLDFIGSALDAKTRYDSKRKEVTISTRRPGRVETLPKGGRLLVGTNIMVNSRRLSSTVPPVMLGKAVMVPAVPVLRELGGKPSWNSNDQRLTADLKGKRYVFTMGDKTVGVSGHGLKLAEAPILYMDQPLIAMDDVGRLFGTHVAYQARQKQIVISAPGTMQRATAPRG